MIDHIQLHTRLSGLSKPVLLGLLIAGLSACAPPVVKEETKPPAPVSEVVVQDEVVQLEKILDQQNSSIMQLELQLLAEKSEIQRLSSAQEQAIQEIVRLKSKLRSRNSKAETVANLAEVKLELQGRQTKASKGHRGDGLERAQQYVAMSEAALEKRNYDGASYLIGQAKYALRTSTASRGERSEGDDDVVRFSLPVRMTVTKRSNVRAGPGTTQKVLVQLNSGSSVLATGYQDLWVRIQRKDDTIGWMHYSLLKAVP